MTQRVDIDAANATVAAGGDVITPGVARGASGDTGRGVGVSERHIEQKHALDKRTRTMARISEIRARGCNARWLCLSLGPLGRDTRGRGARPEGSVTRVRRVNARRAQKDR